MVFGKNKEENLIFTSLSPNTEKEDIKLAKNLILRPSSWKWGENVVKLEDDFRKYLNVNYSFSFNSGRSSLIAILDALDVREGDEILVQGFTCSSVVVPIIKLGAVPVFVDIDKTLNLDPEDLKRKITTNSKVVIVQHTFGYPAQIDKILEIVGDNKLFLIEDCAHSLGSKYKGRFCGTFGDAAFFSFGRDKIISSVFGGMAVTNKLSIAEEIKRFQEGLPLPSTFWIIQQLLHPLFANKIVLPLYYYSGLGRLFLVFLQKIKILSKAVHKKEKRGILPSYFPKRLPNALAVLALKQLKKINRLNSHRKKIVAIYEKGLDCFEMPLVKRGKKREVVFLRYPILVSDSDYLLRLARKEKIFLNDGWRKSPIVPPDTKIEKLGYKLGSCKRAEDIAEKVLNLPTHINISSKEAKRLVSFFKEYGDKRD